MKITASIIGATGYTGIELIRLLSDHPYVELKRVYSRKQAGKLVRECTSLDCDLVYEEYGDTVDTDVTFLALPQTASADIAKQLYKKTRLIDLSADFRFDNLATYESTYGVKHPFPEAKAVYGLCEHNRKQIASADLIANPGCFVTSALLPLLPLKKAGLIDGAKIVIDSASGVSGAGRKSDEAYSFCELQDSYKAYGLFNHRHRPEIEEKLGHAVLFTPHLLPLKRGILSTIYITGADGDRISATLEKAYAKEPFVRYANDLPELKQVTYTNKALMSSRTQGDTTIIVSAIDNLMKGASGQAVQNMNIMFGFDERCGLTRFAPV